MLLPSPKAMDVLFYIFTFIGFVTATGVVATDSCPGKNEVLGCKSTCPDTCDVIGKKYNCPLQRADCEPACRCKPNYFRNKIGECISKEECLKCPGEHEYFSCGKACDNVCATLAERNQTNCPIVNKKCNPKCYCEKNYARDDNNNCIPIENCPKTTCSAEAEATSQVSSESSAEAESSATSSENSGNEGKNCKPPKPKCGQYEKEVSCVNSVCEYRNCSDIGKPIRCVRLDPTKCVKGCVCIDNYLRDDCTGKCIPKNQCPQNQCGKNEIYDICPPICPPQRCDVDERVIRCRKNPEPGDAECKPGCRCIDNYKKDKNGVCIPKEKCPGVVTCGPNEIISSCVNGGCGRWNCSQPGEICVKLAEGACREGCRCIEGYLRADNGTCIPADQCPLICTRKNEVAGCVKACPKRCDSIGKPCSKMDLAVCIPTCNCKPGFYRNDNEDCVPEEQCPKPCGINEVFDVCPATCPPPTCDVDEKVVLCLPNPKPGDEACKPGCRCIDNYKRNGTDVCIPKEECPPIQPKCRPDEVYNECANGGCGRWECSQQGQICIDLVEGGCIPGCRCAEPLLRADDGSCVPADQCPPVCYGQNEVIGCRTLCPETCESIGQTCEIIEPQVCILACRCKPGFYRNEFNECIAEEECSSTTPPQIICRPDEVYNECANGGCGWWECSQGAPLCIDFFEGGCVPGCRCAEPLLRADDGSCVPVDQCPPVCFGQNEVAGCRPRYPQTCENIGRNCDMMEPEVCKPECVCKPGFYRNLIGECISEEQCLQCSGPHEYFTCGGACDNVCATLSIQNQTSCPIINIVCNPKCYCEKGYARDSSDICIPIDDCPINPCGVNEIFDDCPPTCPPPRCDFDEKVTECLPNPSPGDAACRPGCRCIDNYKQNEFGVCIPKEDCPSTTPPQIICRPDEVYNECANGGCGWWECSQGAPLCIDFFEGGCVPGCRCAEPLLRADDGSCVPVDQCPPVCFGQNEVAGCRPRYPQTCENIGRNCDMMEPEVCKPECVCKPGFYRNLIGECISEEQCLQCSGPHEYFTCGGACDNVCATLSIQNQTSCPIFTYVCNPKCYCEKGYARDSSDICIPIDDCPTPIEPTCPPGEVYNACANGGCGRWECSQRGPICIDLVEGGCVPGCRCAEPLLRADDGSCVPADQCPPICNGQNEVAGCRTLCPETCESIGETCDIIEPAVCFPECRCKPGYYRNKIGDCISEEQCLQCSGPHEFFSCGGACDNVCSTLSVQNQTSCPIINIVCNPMCYCEENYARDSCNICIPIEECPINPCGVNEIFDECPPTCPPMRCDIDETLIDCAPNPNPGDPECNPACRCIDNYKRDEYGVCIPKEECPPIQPTCGPDEVYNECANGGCGRWECSQQGQICVDLVEGGCVPGCRCKEPLLRADDGSCVPADKCPLICNGENEISGCKTACPKTCDSIGKKCTINEPAVCIPDCRCKPGFYRNKIGECISEKQCLSCTGPHEIFSCRYANDKFCDDLSNQNENNCSTTNLACNCYCEENYARDSCNTCIPIQDCTDSENGLKKFTEGNNVFTENFLKVGSKINTGVSAIYSPFSLLFLLAQLALYATGVSKQQLFNVLNLQSDCVIRSTIPVYLTDFNSQQNVSLDLAERVYGNIQYKFSKKFLEDTKNIFKAEAQNLDFSKSVESAKVINDWVALQTHDLIQNLVPPDALTADTRLVLVNAIYFKGDWLYPFKKEKTQEQDFYVNSNKTVKVNMMNQVKSFKYAELNKPNVQVLELPYQNRNLSFLVMLPKSKDGINDLIDILGDPSLTFVKSAIDKLKFTTVDVSLPTMEVTTTTDLGIVLRKLNVTAIFDPRTAGFTGILENPETLFVSSAIQKATIIVTETGTKAAAANAIIVGVTSVQQPVEIIQFVANRPYAYFILYNGTPIFCGIYRGPQ